MTYNRKDVYRPPYSWCSNVIKSTLCRFCGYDMKSKIYKNKVVYCPNCKKQMRIIGCDDCYNDIKTYKETGKKRIRLRTKKSLRKMYGK